MCAINPVHKKRVIFDVFTSERCSLEHFNQEVLARAFEIELEINKSGLQRWHLKTIDASTEQIIEARK